MKSTILIIKNHRLWKHWKKVKSGIKTKDFKRGRGYYIRVGLLPDELGKIEELEMKSGKIGLYELVDFKLFRDPWDMVEESWWHLIGYKDGKAIKDCSFKEFLSLYFNK